MMVDVVMGTGLVVLMVSGIVLVAVYVGTVLVGVWRSIRAWGKP